jgi:hypothetical protein
LSVVSGVGIGEAAERLLRLPWITVAQDDEAAVRDLLGQHAVALDHGVGHHLEQRLERIQNLLGLARRHRSLRPKLLLDQRRQLRRPMLRRPRHLEPLRQVHLRHEQEHHDCGQAVAAAQGPIGCAPEAG